MVVQYLAVACFTVICVTYKLQSQWGTLFRKLYTRFIGCVGVWTVGFLTKRFDGH